VVIIAIAFFNKLSTSLAEIPSLAKKTRVIEDIKKDYHEIKSSIDTIKQNQLLLFDEERKSLLEYYDNCHITENKLLTIKLDRFHGNHIASELIRNIQDEKTEMEKLLLDLSDKKNRINLTSTNESVISFAGELFVAISKYIDYIRDFLSNYQRVAEVGHEMLAEQVAPINKLKVSIDALKDIPEFVDESEAYLKEIHEIEDVFIEHARKVILRKSVTDE
jgi:hypothetical protein